MQIAYNTLDGSSYPLEIAGYKMWASTVQTVGTQNEQPVGKAGLTGISRSSELETYYPRRAWHLVPSGSAAASPRRVRSTATAR